MADLPDTLVFATLPDTLVFATLPLNTEMCWQALQAGRIYVRQHPHDAQLFFFDCVNMVVIHQYYHCSLALRRNVYIGMFAQAHPPPQCPAFV